MPKYTTGEIAKICGVSVRTVQYYDTRNILVPSELSEGGRRLYSEDDLKRMKIICFLRNTGLSIKSISELISEDNTAKILRLLLEEQQSQLRLEINEREYQMERINGMMRELKNKSDLSFESIGDMAYVLENKNELKRTRIIILISGIPMAILQWISVILWITMGAWWLFVIWATTNIPYAFWISRYYYKKVAYICPQCHNVFKPRFGEMLWANHTPTLRKLTCPHCSHRGFCVETHGKECTENG